MKRCGLSTPFHTPTLRNKQWMPMTDTSRAKESARGKSLQYSGDLQKLIKKFISDRLQTIPADAPDPAKEIRDELTTFRFDYADLDLIHNILLTNPAIGSIAIDEVFENKGQIPDHMSLMNLTSSAIDRILMKEAQRWWKQEHPKEKAASTNESWYKFLGIQSFYIAREAAVPSGLDLPYKGEGLFNETLGYLQLLQPIVKKDPKADVVALVDKYSPDLQSMELSELLILFGDNPSLISRSAGEHAKRFWNGTIYDVLQGVMEDAVSANAKAMIKLQQQGKLPKSDKPARRQDVDTKVLQTEDVPTRERTRDDSPTRSVDPDEEGTKPAIPSSKKKSSSVIASVVRYQGRLYVRQ